MNIKNNIAFKKSSYNIFPLHNILCGMNSVKTNLMEKYNIFSEGYEKILVKLDEKLRHRKPCHSYKIDINSKNFKENQQNNNFKQDKLTKENNKIHLKKCNCSLDSKQRNIKRYLTFNTEKIIDERIQKDIINSKPSGEMLRDSSKFNVDSIVGGIIPNYNQQISIDMENVDLTFEVEIEKIDTLMETILQFLRRNRNKNNKIKIHALNDVSFKIYKGEKVGIIGYNGAGKSTLLKVIAGIFPPDKGHVKTYGKISPLLSLGAGFDQNYSGRKNIILNGAVLGYGRKSLERKMDEIIEFSELGEYIDVPIKNYSSGMLAKLGFSIATALEPDILIIDEILGVGDVNFQKKSKDKILSLMDSGTTVLFVSHSIPQVRDICDKAIWIENGELIEFGEVNKVCDHYLKNAEKATKSQLANIQLK